MAANGFNMGGLLASLTELTAASARNTEDMQEAARIMKSRMMSREIKEKITKIEGHIHGTKEEIKKAQQSIDRLERVARRGRTPNEAMQNQEKLQTLQQHISGFQMELSTLHQDLQKLYEENKVLLRKKRSTMKKVRNQNKKNQNGNDKENDALAKMFGSLTMGGRNSKRRNTLRSTRRR